MKKSRLSFALDVCPNRLYALAAQVNPASGRITNVFCREGRVQGINNGSVNELGSLCESIDDVLAQLSQACSERIKSLYVSLHLSSVKAAHSTAMLAISAGRSHKVITSQDIAKVNHQAYSLGLAFEERVLHQVVQGYTIDNQNKVANPSGLYGHKLAVDMLLVSSLNQDVENVINAVERSGCRVKSVSVSSVCAAAAGADEASRLKGCVFLDIGFNSSHMLVFKDGILRGIEPFSFGSLNLTKAVAGELRLPLEAAEEIKLAYGSALAEHVSPEQEVLLKHERSYRPLKRRIICRVIEEALGGFFAGLKTGLERYSRNYSFPAGIIVNGQDGLIEGFLERLESNLSLSAHPAKIAADVPLKDTAYAACAGALKQALYQYPKLNLLKLSSYGNILQKISRKSRELYQEYF